MTISPTNTIHPTAIIGPEVQLGTGNYIGPFCLITGKTTIGNNNRFEAYISVGTPGEHKDYFTYTDGEVFIGNDNVFREYITINAGTSAKTMVGNHNFMLRNSHLGHDTLLEDNIILACNVLIGGHSHLMVGCYFGLGSICHQYSIIGAYAMIGMGGIVPKSRPILPGNIYVGNPIEYLKENTVGLTRAGITPEKLQALQKRHSQLTPR